MLRNWRREVWLLIAIIGFFVILAVFVMAIRWSYLSAPQDWEWTGFGAFLQPGDDGFERAKTLWDWMDLILAPLTLAIIAALFTRQVKIREERRKDAEDTREKRARLERYREETLQAYFDEMAALMLTNRLLLDDSRPEKHVLKLAQLRTVTTLRRMTDENGTDTTRVDEILTFLRDSELLGGDRGVLAGATLAAIILPNVNLSGANMQGADLSYANLIGTDLMYANLTRANMYNAKLKGAHLKGTRLQEVNLGGAILQNAIMYDAELQQARLDGANLQNAILSGANLRGSILFEANLRQAQLSNAFFDTSTVLPDGDVAGYTDNSDRVYSPNAYYRPGVTDMTRYTDPDHSDFYHPEPLW